VSDRYRANRFGPQAGCSSDQCVVVMAEYQKRWQAERRARRGSAPCRSPTWWTDRGQTGGCTAASWLDCGRLRTWRWRAGSQPARARSVEQRWRSVCVLNRGTSARKAIRRTIFDQLQRVIGAAQVRSDNDRSSRPRARLSAHRSSKYACSSAPVVADYGTTRSRRLFVVSARTRTVRGDGSEIVGTH